MTTAEQVGELSILNVGAGDIRVTFNHHDRGETQKAMRMLRDMQKRGYAVLVELPDGTYTRATKLDATTNSYVLTLPDEAPVPADAEPVKGRRGRRPGTKQVKVPVRTSKAVGVARSAGG